MGKPGAAPDESGRRSAPPAGAVWSVESASGNLSAHARRLEEAGYLLCRKSFEGRIPRTDYELTGRGRRELEAYLDHMEALIRATRDR